MRHVNPRPSRPSPVKALVRLLVALPLALASWYLLAEGNATAHTIAWWCDGEGCSTDDPRVFLFIGGIAADLVCFVVLMPLLRLIAFGGALALGPLAAMSGWRRAIDAGLPAAEVTAEFRFWGIVAGVGIALVLIGLVYELRATGSLSVLFGRERVPAELGDYRGGKAPGVGAAVLTFRDRSGHPHRRAFPSVPESWTRRAVLAVYPRHDPSRARIAFHWYRPVFVAGGTDDQAAAPAASLTDELERLAALRREGLLSEEEFDQAKRRLLGT